MSKFTKRSTNWFKMEQLVATEEKAKFFAFKSKSDHYFRRVQANPPQPPKIDWAMYIKQVPVPGLVAKFKSEYERLQVPYPKDTLSKEVDAQWRSLQSSIEKYCKERTAEIEADKRQIARIKALPKFDDMTMETAYDMFPNQTLAPVDRPSFWPHTPEEQPGYVEPDPLAAAEKKPGTKKQDPKKK